MTIWVDADNCPSLARTVILTAALRLKISVVFAANHEIPLAEKNPLLKMVVCAKTSGSADDYIVSCCEKGDVVVTRDIPLAQRVLSKQVAVMNDRGLVFDEKNIVRMLKDRELAMQLAAIGVNTGKKYNNYSTKEAGQFSAALNELLSAK
jgi:Uncharacterized protein conserved in bacteria